MFKTGSLRPRLILIVGLALAPLALASIGRGALRLDVDRDDADQELRQSAVYAAHSEHVVLADARAFLGRLADHPQLNAGPEECRRLLDNAMIGTPLYRDMAVLDAAGNVQCRSGQVQPDDAQFWPIVKARHEFAVGQVRYSARLRRNILPVALPIHRPDGALGGAFDGALGAAIDFDALARQLVGAGRPEKAVALVLDTAGGVVASSQPISADLARQAATHGSPGARQAYVTGDTLSGKWRWSAQPLADGGHWIVFGEPEGWGMGVTPIYFFADILLPILMILFAWVAIWLGSEWLVVRWTSYLKRLSVAYGRGHFIGETAEMALAPVEFRLLGQEMAKMAASIQARDVRLNKALRQETALAREIHHRVKNNLQIVSSLISLYSRNLSDPAARQAFRQITVRVDALSLVHRLIEKSGAVPVIAMRALFAELADQVRLLGEPDSEPYQIKLEVEDCHLPVDIATPVALFAVEALSFGLFGMPPQARLVKLSLRASDGDTLLMVVEYPKLPHAALRECVAASARILRALTDQMRGSMWLDEGQGGQLVLQISVPARFLRSGTASGSEAGWGEDEISGMVYDERQTVG